MFNRGNKMPTGVQKSSAENGKKQTPKTRFPTLSNRITNIRAKHRWKDQELLL